MASQSTGTMLKPKPRVGSGSQECTEEGVDIVRALDVLRCLWQCPEDHVLQMLRQSPELVTFVFGFEFKKNDNSCICNHIFERMKHKGHVFHIDKSCDHILAGKCPHVTDEVPVDSVQRCGITLMSAAAALCKEEVVRYLTSAGCSVDCKTTSLRLSPLHYAAMTPNASLLEFLLANKADVNAVCRFEDGVHSPLMLAARTGNTGVVRLILNQPGVRKDFMNQNLIGALTCALENANHDLLDLLTEHCIQATKTTVLGALDLKDPEIMDKVLSTQSAEYFEDALQNHAISVAVKSGAHGLLKVLFKNGFRLHDTVDENQMSYFQPLPSSVSLLHIATLNNDPEMVAILMDGGVSVHDKKVQFYTAYDLAVAMGFEEVKVIMEQKAKDKLHSCVKWQYGPFNALFCLKGIYRPDIIRKLAAKGHNFDEAYEKHKKPIYFAIRCKDTDSLKTLLELGANPDPGRNSEGKRKDVTDSPLACAARLGNMEAVKVLLHENVWLGDMQLYSCKDVAVFRIMVASGATLLKHSQRWKRMRQLSEKWKLRKLEEILETEFDEPPRLDCLSRDVLRRHYSGRGIHEFTRTHPLPTRIKKILLLSDILM